MASPVPNKSDGNANRSPVAAQVLSADGAITIDSQSVVITKATAVAGTLAAPTNPDMNFLTMTITSTTAAAHVVTATDLINGDDDTLTWTAAAGNACILMAYGGEWLTVSLEGVTVG